MSNLFEHDDTFLARWLAGELSQEELTEFENSEDFVMYQRIANKSSERSTRSWNKEGIWEKIREQGEVDFKKKPQKKKSTLRWLILGTAASLLLIVGYWSRYMLTFDVYQTAYAESKKVDLPDGSVVHLNADTEIKFCRKTFIEKRIIKLSGEAFFDVEEGSSFVVETDNGDVRVLGTSFNVWDRENRLDVHCYSGKVGVSFNDFIEEEVLVKGDKLMSKNKKRISHTRIGGDSEGPSWKEGRSLFQNANFIDVIKELERQFDIDINVDDEILGINDYNGGFPHDDMNTALKIVSESIDCEYEIENKTVNILKKRG